MDIHELARLAQELVEKLLSDVELTSTREEHIRLTARANEAQVIANGLYENVISLEAARLI